ncbi:MAG: hypothetical protein ACQESG_00830 [Nanobdellota archaeon]
MAKDDFKSKFGRRKRKKIKKSSGALTALKKVREDPNYMNEGELQRLRFPAIVDLNQITHNDVDYTNEHFSRASYLGTAYRFDEYEDGEVHETKRSVYRGYVWDITPPMKPGDYYEAAYSGFKTIDENPLEKQVTITRDQLDDLEGIVRLLEVRAGDTQLEEKKHFNYGSQAGKERIAGTQILLCDHEGGNVLRLENVYKGFKLLDHGKRLLDTLGTDELSVRYVYTDPKYVMK